ncbi:HIRAN domain-containing protein [Roseibium sp. MMSF_3361]|uniref:HIRAN domain-containing protein n=2 Tax=unclassified Roseibium TaxID=2629323 RepID=UPI00273EF5A0|nr:HIRAN domain-containing protein [Roseibium sp. MMSF_3361]
MQFYDYDCPDERSGNPIRPVAFEQLELVRQPDNKEDPNAIEVRFRNGTYKLGFVDRLLAVGLAHRLDKGHSAIAYAISGGDGEPWSVKMLIIGKAVSKKVWRQNRKRKNREIRDEADRLVEEMLMASAPARYSPIDLEQAERRGKRLNQAVSTLWQLIPDVVPDALKKVPRSIRKGHVFERWKDVPETLKTKNGWAELERSVPGKTDAHATVEYTSHGRPKTARLYNYKQTKRYRRRGPSV